MNWARSYVRVQYVCMSSSASAQILYYIANKINVPQHEHRQCARSPTSNRSFYTEKKEAAQRSSRKSPCQRAMAAHYIVLSCRPQYFKCVLYSTHRTALEQARSKRPRRSILLATSCRTLCAHIDASLPAMYINLCQVGKCLCKYCS